MALTDEELGKITNIETAVNVIQSYVTNLASKTIVRQLNLLREKNIEEINTRIDNLNDVETPNNLTVGDLSIFATKAQMKQLLLLNQQEILSIKNEANASSYLRTMQDVTIEGDPESGQILLFDLIDGWKNEDLASAGFALTNHIHNLESLGNVSTSNAETGYILQYNAGNNTWAASEANMAQIMDGPAGAFGIYNEATSTIVPLTAVNWDSTNLVFQIQGQLTLSGSTEIKGQVINNITDAITTLDTFNLSEYRTVKYLIEMKDEITNSWQSQEILLVHDDQEVYISEFGVIFTSEDNFTTFTAELDINASSITLRCQCTGTNNVAKLTRIVMTA